MFRTKSMYIVWIVLAVAVLFTTFLCKTDYDSLNKEDASQQEQFTEPTAENINVGMMVTLPTEPGEKVTVYDIFYANSQGKFYALFLVIFAVLFSTADIGSGYIKNIGGQVQKRGALIFSRSIALAVFMALTMTGAFILQAVANYIVFGQAPDHKIREIGGPFFHGSITEEAPFPIRRRSAPSPSGPPYSAGKTLTSF